MVIDLQPDGRVRGVIDEAGCKLSGLHTQFVSAASASIDVTVSGCHDSRFNTRTTAQLRAAWQRGDFVPLLSTATAQELVRVLACPKFRLDAQSQQELLADYLPYTLVIKVPDPPSAVPVCRDLFDLPFLQLAVAGKADALVTGDVDLLVLGGKVRFRLLPPEASLQSLRPPAEPPA